MNEVQKSKIILNILNKTYPNIKVPLKVEIYLRY